VLLGRIDDPGAFAQRRYRYANRLRLRMPAAAIMSADAANRPTERMTVIGTFLVRPT
jgi:hypothetical protein